MRQIYPLDAATRRAIEPLLPDRRSVEMLLGAHGDTPQAATTVAGPLDRIREALSTIEAGMRTVAAQAQELDDDDYRAQARGEIMASLICLREIWERLPEFWQDEGQSDER